MTDEDFKSLIRFHQYFPELSPREAQVFLLCASGFKVANVHVILKKHMNIRITKNSVNTYIERIKEKIEMSDISESRILLMNRVVLYSGFNLNLW